MKRRNIYISIALGFFGLVVLPRIVANRPVSLVDDPKDLREVSIPGAPTGDEQIYKLCREQFAANGIPANAQIGQALTQGLATKKSDPDYGKISTLGDGRKVLAGQAVLSETPTDTKIEKRTITFTCTLDEEVSTAEVLTGKKSTYSVGNE